MKAKDSKQSYIMASAEDQSNSSESEPSRIQRGNEEIDWISNLPEAVIHHIFSFVSTIDVVQTSLLAKRWRYLWTQTPDLHFDDSRNAFFDREDAFANFVTQVHSLHKAPKIGRYYLLVEKPDNAAFVDKWVHFAVQMNVTELKIQANVPMADFQAFQMPCSSSVRDLKLHLRSRDLTLPGDGFFSSLDNLFLSSINLIDDTILYAVSHRCPCLRSLRFSNCTGLNRLDIRNPMLETLMIERCEELDQLSVSSEKLQTLLIRESFTYGKFSVKILAPSLQSFEWFDYVVGEFFIGNFTSLQSAHVSLVVDFIPQHNPSYIRSATDLLKGLACAKSLTVEMPCFWALPTQRTLLEGLPAPLHNLKHMKLFVDFDVDLDIFRKISYLFKSCPNLETLHINTIDDETQGQLPIASDFDEGESWSYQSHPLVHLRQVKILRFRGNEYEIEFVEFLLAVAAALKSVFIQFSSEVSIDQTAKDRVVQRIMALKSTQCFCEVY